MDCNITLMQPTPSDYNGIVSLFLSSDPRHQRSVSYYNYSNYSGYGDATRIIAKNEKGLIIGHYSILPLDFKYQNKIYKVGYAQQAVIHKSYRNLKLITQLHDYAIRKAKKNLNLEIQKFYTVVLLIIKMFMKFLRNWSLPE